MSRLRLWRRGMVRARETRVTAVAPHSVQGPWTVVISVNHPLFRIGKYRDVRRASSSVHHD